MLAQIIVAHPWKFTLYSLNKECDPPIPCFCRLLSPSQWCLFANNFPSIKSLLSAMLPCWGMLWQGLAARSNIINLFQIALGPAVISHGVRCVGVCHVCKAFPVISFMWVEWSVALFCVPFVLVFNLAHNISLEFCSVILSKFLKKMHIRKWNVPVEFGEEAVVINLSYSEDNFLVSLIGRIR